MPGLCKVGKTTGDPYERAKQLSGTGVPTPYIVAYYRQVLDCSSAEKLIHSHLSYARVNNDREFFRVDAKVAIDAIIDLCGGASNK